MQTKGGMRSKTAALSDAVNPSGQLQGRKALQRLFLVVAVALAALLNLVGAFLSTEVAKTISGGLIREGSGGVRITPEIIFAGLLGAIIWNLLTWLFGLPSSSSHALFGGLIGATIVGMGFEAVDFNVLTAKVILPAAF